MSAGIKSDDPPLAAGVSTDALVAPAGVVGNSAGGVTTSSKTGVVVRNLGDGESSIGDPASNLGLATTSWLAGSDTSGVGETTST